MIKPSSVIAMEYLPAGTVVVGRNMALRYRTRSRGPSRLLSWLVMVIHRRKTRPSSSSRLIQFVAPRNKLVHHPPPILRLNRRTGPATVPACVLGEVLFYDWGWDRRFPSA